MEEQKMREYIFTTIMENMDDQQERRREAIMEYLSVTMPNLTSRESEKIAELIPPVLPALYEKWIREFIDRLFETVPKEQIQELCSGDKKNKAALLLVYIMFMESERMEKRTAKDLAEYGIEQSSGNGMGDVAANLLRAKMAQIKDMVKNTQ